MYLAGRTNGGLRPRHEAGTADRKGGGVKGRPQPAYRTRLLVKDGARYSFVLVEEIEWIEAAGNYARLHVAGEGTHLIRAALSDLESELDPRVFLRIHRGAIVNLDRVGSIHRHAASDYKVVMGSGRSVRVGRTYRDALLQRRR